MRRLFTTEDARSSGSTHAALRWGVRARRWRRVVRGVYADGPEDPSELDALAGPITWIADVRCASGLQTLVDLAATLDDATLEQALESALRTRLTSVAELEGVLPDLRRSRTPGVARIRRVLRRRPPGAPPTESLLETLAVQLARTVDGLPEPVRQHDVVDAAGLFVARVDLAWPDLGLFVELDGEHHEEQPVHDARRDAAVLAATGWLCARFTWREVAHVPRTTARARRAGRAPRPRATAGEAEKPVTLRPARLLVMTEQPGASPFVDYERVAGNYDTGRALPPDVIARWGDAVRPHLPARPIVVADVGAGTGIFVSAWAQWAPATVIALEPSVAMLAAQPPGSLRVRGVAERLPLADGSVDVAWISAALHHFAEAGQAVAELARVVVPDGRILVRTHLPGRTALGWLEAFPGHDRANERFPRLDGLAALFAPVGFWVAAVEEVLEGVHTHEASAEWVERMRDADSILTALTDEEIAQGLAALRAEPARDVQIELSLVVLAR